MEPKCLIFFSTFFFDKKDIPEHYKSFPLYTECNKSPVTEFRASSLSYSYIKTTYHRMMQLTYVNGLVFYSTHAKGNWKILIFYPIFNFSFPH